MINGASDKELLLQRTKTDAVIRLRGQRPELLHASPPPARECLGRTRNLLVVRERTVGTVGGGRRHVASHTLHRLTSLDPPPSPCAGGPHCPCFVIFPTRPIIPFPGEKQSVLDLKEKGPCLYHVQLSSHQNASALVCRARATDRKRESAAAGGRGWGLVLSSAVCPQWR